MGGIYLTPDDLDAFATIEHVKAQAMIDDAEAQAVLAAPCLSDAAQLSDAQRGAVKAVLRRAILRWHDIGGGAVTQETAGPFTRSVDTSSGAPRSLFWPSEIRDLQAVCRQVGGSPRGAFSVDMTPSHARGSHHPWCSLAFGASYCSCGSDINNGSGPIFGGQP